MTAYVCPECGESATHDAHLDGAPLCPVVGAAGYEPARAVLVDSPEGRLVQDRLLGAFGADAALDVIRNGTSEQDALSGALGSAGSYGLDLDGIAPAVGASFREHLASYRGRRAH